MTTWRHWLLVTAMTAGSVSAFASVAELIASPEPGWPQFRGPRRDGICDERGLLQSWPEVGPKELWSTQGAGRGFSSAIIADRRIFLTGDFGEDVFVVAYDLTGKPLWRAKNGAAWVGQYPGARASVTVSEGRVYHENAHGRVACFEAATGREIWAVNLLERFRGENIMWGMSECLLVDERAVYACAGGRDAWLVALDKRSGEVLWRTEPPREKETGSENKNAIDGPGYAAPILVRFAGHRLIVGCSARNLFCVEADTGKVHWTRPRPTSYGVIAMSPVLVGDAVFISAPLGPPGRLYRLVAPARPGATVGVEEGWTTGLDTVQGGVVHADGRLYGSYYGRGGGWTALDAATGKVLYAAPEMIKGAVLHANRRLYALCEDGWMLLLNPTAEQFEIAGRFRLATARDKDAWGHPVIHDGRMYLRFHDTLHCYDVRAAAP